MGAPPVDNGNCCSRFCQGVRDTIRTGCNTAVNSYTISRAGKAAVAGINLAEVYTPLSEGTSNVRTALRGTVKWLDAIDIISRVREWFLGEVKGFWKVLSRICLTVFQAIGVMNLLDALKVIDFKAMLSKLSHIPVLGTLITLPSAWLYVGSTFFSAFNNGSRISSYGTEAKKNAALKEALEIKKQVYGNLGNGRTMNALQQRYFDAKHHAEIEKGKLGETVDVGVALNRKIQTKWDNFVNLAQAFSKQANAANRIQGHVDHLDHRIKVIDAREYNANLTRSKSIVGIINDIMKTLFISLGLIGAALGVALISFEAVPMLFFGAVAAGFSLFKCFYEAQAPKTVSA